MFLTFVFNNVVVNGYTLDIGGDSTAKETLNMVFAKCRIEYEAQEQTGSVGTAITGGWDMIERGAWVTAPEGSPAAGWVAGGRIGRLGKGSVAGAGRGAGIGSPARCERSQTAHVNCRRRRPAKDASWPSKHSTPSWN